ncbi:MFS transporter [Streptomyces sp. NPDC017941]|uniref:MFS transporter n=1 Tax=Streptomyces sp. NPDC017941 TaxID=3365018 RepID=UPI0037A678F5
MASAVETPDAGTRSVAWRGGFGRLWSAAALSSFGDALRKAALPLLAASLTDDPLLIASVTACGYLPWLVLGLLGGAVADRVDQRRAMWMVDVVRGLLVAALVVLVTHWLHAGSGGYAAAITAYAAGSLVGGALAGRLARRFGRVRSVLVAGTAQVAALVAMGTIRDIEALVVSMTLFGAMGMVWNVSSHTLMQQRPPAAVLGRVSSAFRTLAVAGAPLGAVLGGAATALWGPRTPMLLAAALFALSVLALTPLAESEAPVVESADSGQTTRSGR